ncbi:MAG: hypothetical protein KQA41_00645 [Candidatus Aenigmarchaeota archaeon]|nr:hypothetical protein [Candidatus Aenigmarchaeota archaeon]
MVYRGNNGKIYTVDQKGQLTDEEGRKIFFTGTRRALLTCPDGSERETQISYFQGVIGECVDEKGKILDVLYSGTKIKIDPKF